MLILPPQEKRYRSIFGSVLAWCHGCAEGILAAHEHEHLNPVKSQDSGTSGVEPPSLARYCYDASLLFSRMARLQIDREKLANEDPLLFRELQGLCTLCRSKEECVRDLAQESDAAAEQPWYEYCPNAPTLNALGAVHCSWAARHLKTPRSTRFFYRQ